MAKGVEDTAFYRYGTAAGANDVGGDPGRFGIEVERLPRGLPGARATLPAESLLTTQTHDAKRSADVRARIAALASIAEDWEQVVSGWMELTEPPPQGRRPGRRRALLPVPDAGRRLADRARARAGVHGEGAAGGQAQHQLDRSGPRVGAGGQALLRGAVRRPGVPGAVRAVRPAGGRGGRARRARPGGAEAHRPRGARISTRATSSRSARWSTPTTADRSTGAGARRCSPG